MNFQYRRHEAILLQNKGYMSKSKHNPILTGRTQLTSIDKYNPQSTRNAKTKQLQRLSLSNVEEMRTEKATNSYMISSGMTTDRNAGNSLFNKKRIRGRQTKDNSPFVPKNVLTPNAKVPKLNISMQFKQNEFYKLERQLNHIFCTDTESRDRQQMMSGDSKEGTKGSTKAAEADDEVTIEKSDSQERKELVHRKWHVEELSSKMFKNVQASNQKSGRSQLPQISESYLDSIQGRANPRYKIETDGMNLMSYRAHSFKQHQQFIKVSPKQYDGEIPFQLKSQHNKFQRIKEGGWGETNQVMKENKELLKERDWTKIELQQSQKKFKSPFRDNEEGDLKMKETLSFPDEKPPQSNQRNRAAGDFPDVGIHAVYTFRKGNQNEISYINHTEKVSNVQEKTKGTQSRAPYNVSILTSQTDRSHDQILKKPLYVSMSMEQKKHKKDDQLENIFKNQAVQSKYRMPMPVSRESVRKQQLAGAQFQTRTTTAENQTSIQASIERYRSNLQQTHQRHQSNLKPLGNARNVPLTVIQNHSLQAKQPQTAVESHHQSKFQNSLNPSLQMLNEYVGSSSSKGAKWARRDAKGTISKELLAQKQASEEKPAVRKLSKSLKFPMDIEKLNSMKFKER